MNTSFPEVIDDSLLKTWRSCQRQAQLGYFEHWKPQGDQIHLLAGAAFARGLEVVRQKYWEDAYSFEDALATGALALAQAWGDYEPPEGSKKTLDSMLGALDFYFQKWPIDTDYAKPHTFPSGKRGIEFSFAEPVDFLHPETGNPLIYAGRADQISDFSGGLYVQDEKTTSQLGATWAKQWDLRSQFTGYCWAAAKGGLAVSGVLVRGVSILKRSYDSAEAITYRSQWEIDNWYEQVIRELATMRQAWESGIWNWNWGDACNSYGGCQFRQICKSPQPDVWLPVSFERRRWDPLTRTETRLEVA